MLSSLVVSLSALAVGANLSCAEAVSMNRSHWLSSHNRNRAMYGADKLSYGSDQLQRSAQDWADGCNFEHSSGDYGENLAYVGSTGQLDVDFQAHAMQPWMSEASNQGGHFTQVVWQSTTQVACAASACPAGTIADMDSILYVCQYTPPGNVIGQYKENVGAKKSKRSVAAGENWGVSARA